MENQESSSYEGLFIIGSMIIAFTLTYITKRQREAARKQKKERKQLVKDLAELKRRFE